MSAKQQRSGGPATPSQRVVSNFPQQQWDLFERICQQQAGMDGRKALKHLVAHSAITGCFPIPKAGSEAGGEVAHALGD